MDLSIRKIVNDTTVTLYLKGTLDISTVLSIPPYLENIPVLRQVILDFSEIEFLDSTGIGSIMEVIYLSREKQFTLVLQGERQDISQIFEVVGVYQLLDMIQEESYDK